MNRTPLRGMLLVISSVFAISCGGDASLSPTAPSRSGVGGQMDFNRGAALAPEGRAIIALPSTAGDGSISRITPTVAGGAGVVTTRAHVRTVVTEWGVAELFGRTIRERATALIAIAHPDHRDRLAAEAHDRHLI